MNIHKEYYPDYIVDFKYYYYMREDNSKIYMILNPELNRVYITEDIF